MNREYINIGNSFIVRDDNDNQRIIKSINNIDEILIQENVIELIENKLINLENRNRILSNGIKEDKKWSKVYFIISIITFLITSLISNGLVNSFATSRLMSSIVTCLLSFAITMLPFSIGIQSLNSYKRYLKEKDGINSELTFLNKKLTIEKEKLNELKEEYQITKDSVKDVSIIKVDDKKINDINNECLLYYDCGINKDKYYKYLEMNILDKKLSKKYNFEEIEKVKEYTNGLKLVRKK